MEVPNTKLNKKSGEAIAIIRLRMKLDITLIRFE